jgi:hypothetical protein
MGSLNINGGTFTTTVKGTPTDAVVLEISRGFDRPIRIRGQVVPSPDRKTSSVTFDLSTAARQFRNKAAARAQRNMPTDISAKYTVYLQGYGIYSPVSGPGTFIVETGDTSYSGASDGVLPDGPVTDEGEEPAAGATAYGESSPGDLLDPPIAPSGNPCLPPQPSPSSPQVPTPCGGGSSSGVAGFSS